MNGIICDMLNSFVFVYLDGIVIFSRTLSKNQQHLCLVLQGLQNELYVKAEKLYVPKISFLDKLLHKE